MGFIPKNGPHWGLQIFLLLLIFVSCHGELPTEINAFMDKLFENDECEEFVSGDFTSVATTDCEPYSCDFPRQICQRPSATPSDKTTNQCRDVPTRCLTAANGGVPVGPPRSRPTAPPLPPPSIFAKPLGGHGGFTSGPPRPVDPVTICSMGPPSASRFCGFQLKYTYNKETLQCDQFWFPGCPTAETNSNLFEDYPACQRVAEMCRPTPPPFRPIPMPVPTIAPLPPPPPPPAPTPPSPIPGGIPFLGSGTGVGTPMGGTGMTGGDGEDVNLFGFIQKGISAAQAIKQGGPQGKEAASAAAGQILSQFTGFDLNNFGGNFGNFFGG